jgi:hypothetical protein
MNVALWILVIMNIVAAGAAAYISLHVPAPVVDALKVLADINVLNAVALIYSLIRKTGQG